LSQAVIIEPLRDSYVLSVKVRLGDKDLAPEVLAGVLAEYKQQHIDLFQTEQGVEFFQGLKDQTEKELKDAQGKLQTFRTANNISMLDTQKELLLEQFAEAQKLSTQLQDLQEAIGGVDETVQVSQDSPLISALSSQTESPVVREMQLRLLELMLERNRVVQSLGPQHPTVQSLRQQVSLAYNDLVAAIKNTLQITDQKLGEYRTDLNRLNETEAELTKLEQDVEIKQKDYEFYSGKLQESTVAQKLGSDEFRISSVRVSSPPSIPVDPIWPRKLLNLGLALVGGLIAALALAFLLDYLDHGIKTPEDVEYYVKVPPLASFFNSGSKPLDTREAERLAAMLDTISPTGIAQIVEVTSSVAGEGSHQVAIALADAYANDPDSKTLLVDFSGEIPRAKGASVGLTDVLLDQADFDEVFGANERLIVVSRGSHSEYPTYLWASERMTTLVGELRKRFKHVIFHVGPILQSHDALKLAHTADGVLLVIKSDGTRREVVNRAVTMVKDSNAKVVGAVLTHRTQTIPSAVYRRI
jgi:Mrp family chromosome partitioning ATPase/LPS O-antigen subunit length determinant protein (WzzB/FepE family)